MATPVQPNSQGFPQISAPMVDDAGTVTQSWYKFFIALWVRSGGSQGQPGPYIPSDVIITGGTIDGTAIGSTVPSTGDFTTLHANSTLSASNFTGSSTGVNTGNVSLAGDNYLTIAGQVITAHNINLGTQVTGNIATSNLPTAGVSATITTAKLTVGGTNGSQTFTNGLLTSSTPAT